jgi:UDPglucose 6-dehydrogenase
MQTGREMHSPVGLIEEVAEYNEKRKADMAARVIAALGGDVKNKTIGILGVTFKPNTDDMREAPSLVIIPALQHAGARVQAYDPIGMHEAAKFLPDVEWCADAPAAAHGADILVIITEWNEFRALDLDRIKSALKFPLIFDMRNIYKPMEMAAAGFTYHSLGRPLAVPKNLKRAAA